jgi:hypothetical protein
MYKRVQFLIIIFKSLHGRVLLYSVLVLLVDSIPRENKVFSEEMTLNNSRLEYGNGFVGSSDLPEGLQIWFMVCYDGFHRFLPSL